MQLYTLKNTTKQRLRDDLTLMSLSPSRAKHFRRRRLCSTLQKRDCDLVTITDYAAPLADIRLRRCVVLTARVHPGECNASHVMLGFLRFLTSDARDARLLRHTFVFKST
jgi:hypothetical protein